MSGLLEWQGVFAFLATLLVVAVVVVLLGGQLRAMAAARAALTRDDAYRDLTARIRVDHPRRQRNPGRGAWCLAGRVRS
jgi:hypothetical protein